MKAVVTIKTADEESERRFKEWLADAHGGDVAFANALRDEIKSWCEADTGAEVTVDVTVTERA